ncbi:sigma-70 family RNA polymerase sigma factor [Pseudomonas sp. B21-053]|uniref:sigma-70 family RNA polymerase sigma factor n=1 Tax=Pseudomonas sp. B21-053 TaxID=2895493 RepID=UPI0022327336|nr:sigma-70 family RNA polymerase sigma factor [Pseudomonas sp. B21-053]UZE10116.1 sigma-70 family RNA polymerase sigma factor [Pseudomonas sp. B21-053]
MSSADQPLNQQVHHLYSEHHDWLQGWLHRKLGNRCDAADLAHDTFLRLLTRQVVRPLGSEPRALLTHIAKGLVIDRWRRQDLERAYLETIAHLPAAEVPSPETRFLILETLTRIEALLRELPAVTRDTFLLSQIEGLTYSQIATRLNVSLITVKRHMRAAFIACLSVA